MIDVQCEQEKFALGYRVLRALAIGQWCEPCMAARLDASKPCRMRCERVFGSSRNASQKIDGLMIGFLKTL
ncbi:hypothetical protein ACWX0K_22020 [Nitrobacteraceae bacterium UC4446_H13]|jgi:hypothetical protein